MKIIGITGGVGSGKSEILKYLEENPRFLVREADKIAHSLIEKGGAAYDGVLSVLGEDVLNEDGSIDRAKMAAKIFNSPPLLRKTNSVIHPAVEAYVKSDIAESGKISGYDIYFLEAALLIECGYDKICDELWYIYAEEAVRRERLKKSRGYSDEKIDGIIKSQLPDSEYRKYCRHIIDNSGELKATIRVIDGIISGYTR